MFARKKFVMTRFPFMPLVDLVPWLNGAAILQEKHHFFGTNWSEWVPGPATFRKHAVDLTEGMEAAKYKDQEKTRELEKRHAETLLSINMNATYIVMRALHEKNESLLHNVGYVLKDPSNKKEKVTALKSHMRLKVKNLDTDGAVAVTFEKDPAAALYQLQWCKGTPSGEESWQDYALRRGVRVTVTDLERACWYYFRGRSQGDNETGPWSPPEGTIVT